MTKDQWIQQAKALLFDVCQGYAGLKLIEEAYDLIESGGGYDVTVESPSSELKWCNEE